MKTKRTLLLSTALAALAIPAVASADSIVYVDGGNVWSARPDGSAKVQLTQGGDWHSPTQADDGTIAAVEGTEGIRVLARDGRPLRTIATAQAPSGDGGTFAASPVELSFSPDGSKIAYSYVQYSCPPASTCGNRETATAVTDAGVATATPRDTYGYQMGLSEPEWASSSRLLVSGGAGIGVSIDDIPSGQNSTRPWITPSKDIGDPELSRDGRHLATTFDYGDNTQILFLVTHGDPRSDAEPQQPDLACQSNADAQNADPSWSPDGMAVAWQNSGGIVVNRFSSIAAGSCETADNHVLTPTGSEPDWGPADPPAAAYVPGNQGGGGVTPGPTPAPTAAPSTGGTLKITSTAVKRRALKRGRARLRVAATRPGAVKVRLSSGRTTITTGTAKVAQAGRFSVHLRKAKRRGLRAIAGRGSVLVTVTLSTPGQERLEQSLSLRVK